MEECRHIRVNGTKCRAAALCNTAWCYFHANIYRGQARKSTTTSSPRFIASNSIIVPPPGSMSRAPSPPSEDVTLSFPLLEDISSIQLAISRVLYALAANQIEARRAGLLLYGLQIAAQNLPREEINRHNTVYDIERTQDGIDFDARPYDPKEDDGEYVNSDSRKDKSTASLVARLNLTMQNLEDLDGNQEQDEVDEEEEDDEEEDDEEEEDDDEADEEEEDEEDEEN